MISVDSVFTALADPTRRQLLETLGQHGAASASRLATQRNISRQAIAKHLNVLEQAGLVERVKKGKEICFSATPAQLAAAGRWLQRTAKRWEDQHNQQARAGAAPCSFSPQSQTPPPGSGSIH